jgi:uncharacterized membrane protein
LIRLGLRGVDAPSTDLPIQQTTASGCVPTGKIVCVDEGDGNSFWPTDLERDLIGAKPEKLDLKYIARIRNNYAKSGLQLYWNSKIAKEYLRAGRFDLFFPEINEVIKIWYSSSHALLMRADALAVLGRDDLALADVNAAIFWASKRKHDWVLGFMYATKAEVLMRLRNKAEATQAIRMANSLRDPSRFTQYYRIDWANEMAFPVLYGVSFKDVKDALTKPIESKCTPISPMLIIAQKAQYRNFESIRQTLPIHEACMDWALMAAEAQWMVAYAMKPETMKSNPDAAMIRQDAVKKQVVAHAKLRQYREAEIALMTELKYLGMISSARPFENALAQVVASEMAAGGTPDAAVSAELSKRVAARKVEDQELATLDAASGRVTMCNMSTHHIRMVLNYVEYKGSYHYVTRGWEDISSGNCLTYRVEGGTYLYYHAVDSVTYEMWGGSDKICVATFFGNWMRNGNDPCTGNFEVRSAKGVLAPTGAPQRVEFQ